MKKTIKTIGFVCALMGINTAFAQTTNKGFTNNRDFHLSDYLDENNEAHVYYEDYACGVTNTCSYKKLNVQESFSVENFQRKIINLKKVYAQTPDKNLFIEDISTLLDHYSSQNCPRAFIKTFVFENNENILHDFSEGNPVYFNKVLTSEGAIYTHHDVLTELPQGLLFEMGILEDKTPLKREYFYSLIQYCKSEKA